MDRNPDRGGDGRRLRVLHLAALVLLWSNYRRIAARRRYFAGLMVLGAFVAHLLEVGLFAAVIIAVAEPSGADLPHARMDFERFDALYYSATFYTAVGGPHFPTKPMRLLTVVETLTEVTSALDWDNGQQMMKILVTAAHEHGATVLAVTHDRRLLPVADRILRLEDGTLKDDETTSKSSPADLRHFGGKSASRGCP